jgi:aromatic ring-opening dioxygenase catalytic subunit (LigB family)
MGQIVGAAIVSHHPGLFQTDEFRLQAGAGRDSDLVAGYERVRARIDAIEPDLLVIFDSHWFTTGYHLVDGGAHYAGVYVSDEMPWYLHGRRYDYTGAPEVAALCQEVAEERGVLAKNIVDPGLPRQYATLNVVEKLRRGEDVLSVGNCQTCKTRHFLEMGEVVGEAIRRSGRRAVLLASGALSHKFNDLDWVQKNPRIYDAANVSDPRNIESDHEVIGMFEQGRHDLILERFAEYRAIPWEGLGGHYLQMIGALGGSACHARGETLSEYENARGTGNIHIWFEVGDERTERSAA